MENEILESDEDKDSIVQAYLDKKIQLKNAEKQLKISKEKALVEQAIASMNYSNKRDKVACILNLYPDSRDSDLTLTIRFWEVFQAEIYRKNSHISPHDLFKLERLTTIARIRAKIQNEYGLFLGSEATRAIRRKREDEVRDDVLNDNSPPKLISIYADETGKNEKYIIVGSVWFLDMRKAAMFQSKVNVLKEKYNFSDKNGRPYEFHFSRMQNNQFEIYKSFVDLVAQNRDFITFKSISTLARGTTRPVEDVVKQLYDLLVTKGFETEYSNGRVSLPRKISFIVDKSDGLDAISKATTMRDVNSSLKTSYDNEVSLENISEIDSKESAAIQLADIVAGALNRLVNMPDKTGLKTDFANYVINKLALMDNESDAYTEIELT